MENLNEIALKLKGNLQSLQEQISNLGGYELGNAFKLARYNDTRHNIAGELVDLGIIDTQTYIFGCDETNRDINISLISPKKKELESHSHHYNSGLRNLQYEIEDYIGYIDIFIEKAK